MIKEPKRDLVLSIDIGNSFTKAGIITIDNLECVNKSIIQSSEITNGFSEVLKLIFQKTKPEYLSRTVISSTVKSAQFEVERVLEENGVKNVIRFEYDEKLPVKINYSDPRSLGKDRIANILFAKRAYPQKNCILICAGTALIIDLFKSTGEFIGGSIIPGLDMQFRALHEFTDALPLVKFSTPVSNPGRSTEECIKSGVVYGICGAINSIVNQYCMTLDENAIVLASGGSWPEIASFINLQHIYIPEMTLLGTALFGSDCQSDT